MTKLRKTKELLLQILDKKNSNILLLGEYTGCKNKIRCKCKVCGFELEIAPTKLISKNLKCKMCTKERVRKENTLSLTEWINKAKAVHNNKYDYSKVEYINSKTKVCIICPEHGEFWLTPDSHTNGKNGCPKCAWEQSNPILLEYSLNRNKQCKEYFIERANNIHNNEYEYLEEYKTAMEKIKIKHKSCGHEFYITPHNHIINKEGCPICNCSKGEKYINKILNNNSINYIYLYELPIDININSSGKAYIDFYLPDLNIAIEYNGEQHYRPIHFFGGKLKLVLLQKRDNYIRDYCKNNNIQLIEFSYTNSENDILETIKSKIL